MSKFEFQVDPRQIRVDIGMPVHFPYLPFPTVVSLVDTIKACTAAGIETRQVSPVGCSIVTDARSAIVDEFLKGDATHLFWVDADIHWLPQDFMRLLTLCTQVEVVGATYPLKVEPIRFIVRRLGKKTNKFGLIDVEGLGLGFTVMRREVVEKIAADKRTIITNGGQIPMREVFTLERTETGYRMGEDIKFFQDIREAGYTVWLDPMVNVAHVGIKLYAANVEEVLTEGLQSGEVND
jgi:hypothetical protein